MPFARQTVKQGVVLTFAILSLRVQAARAHIVELQKVTAGYLTGLTVPSAGIRAGDPVEFFLRIHPANTDPSNPDPSNPDPTNPDPNASSPGASCTNVHADIIMPFMKGMPPLLPAIRTLGYTGSYSLKTVFPHGGSYRLNIRFTPENGTSPIDTAYLLAVEDESNDPAAWRPFDLKVKSAPTAVSAGHKVNLTLTVSTRDTGEIVRDFDVLHEKLIHLIVVRDDLGQFFHEHPVLQPDGTFSLQFAFPTAGSWRLFADMAPAGAGAQVAMASLAVAGPPAGPRSRLEPVSLPVLKSGYSVASMTSADVAAHRPSLLVFSLKDSRGIPITDLEPWLGSRAHLVLIGEDATTFVHSHPDEAPGSVDPDTPLAFQARFPKPGLYRGWLQFQRSGQVVTLTFALRCP